MISWIVVGVFAAFTLAVLYMLSRLKQLLTPPRHLRAAAHKIQMLNMVGVAGGWEISVAAVLVSMGSYSASVAPGLMGITFVGARVVVPAMDRRLHLRS